MKKLLFLMFLLLSACAQATEITPQEEPTQLPAETEVPLTETLSPTNTLPPTSTPTISSTPSPQITSSRGIDIQEQGAISIGINQSDVFPLVFQDGNSYSGFEIDLATEIVQRLFGDQLAIDWIPIASKERVVSVQNGDIDFLIRSFVRTTSREELVSFTSSYFLDGVGLFVRPDSGYTSIEGLDGKTILVPNEVYVSPVQNAASEAGVEVSVLVVEDIYQAFDSGQGDAIAVNWLAHIISANDHNQYQAIGDLIDSYPIAIAVSLDDPDFREEIDMILLEIIMDGTWQTIYDNWIPVPPLWTIEEMLSEPALDR